MKQQKKGRSVQELIGIKTFTKYGLMTGRGELLFFRVAPTNISVLSHANIEVKIRHLMMVLSALPDIEIICTDSSECFDDNKSYLQERQNIGTYEHSSPLFLSLQNKRINVRTIENLVKKYAGSAVPLKKITPHKLRSTYGTMLYQNTGDIYLVADVLGHKDVNTTRKHYAAMSEENRKMEARAVKLKLKED